RDKQVLIKGDEPTVHQQSRRSLSSPVDALSAIKINEGIISLKISENSSENNVQLPSPLPLPLWAKESKPTLNIEKLYAYEDLVALIDTTLQHMMEETHYNTVNNFIDFYQAFKASSFKNLREFFQIYSPPVNRRHHMCVSLAMEIVARIATLRPNIAEHFYLVSCEEAVEDTISYIENCDEKSIEAAAWSLEKEHSLVAMKIMIAGREGLMIIDPGYHVARAVTVMKDQNYPHTGFFTQSDEPGCKREYCYTFSHMSDNFITWRERTTRNGQQKYEISLIYVDRPYKTAIDVTVRRNLVYDFRSLLSRDPKGRVFAGIYFPVVANATDSNITIFYDEGIDNKILKTKVKFSAFKDVTKIPESIMNHLKKLEPQLRIELSTMIDMLKTLTEIVTDADFVKQSLAINDVIAVLSADN
ncbi:CLUMA_CG012002, isoform A, partial [Clunio marinus]